MMQRRVQVPLTGALAQSGCKALSSPRCKRIRPLESRVVWEYSPKQVVNST